MLPEIKGEEMITDEGDGKKEKRGGRQINKNKGVLLFRGISVCYALQESPKINTDLIRSRFADASLFFGPGFVLIWREIRQGSVAVCCTFRVPR
jgi:hypothetical protein